MVVLRVICMTSSLHFTAVKHTLKDPQPCFISCDRKQVKMTCIFTKSKNWYNYQLMFFIKLWGDAENNLKTGQLYKLCVGIMISCCASTDFSDSSLQSCTEPLQFHIRSWLEHHLISISCCLMTSMTQFLPRVHIGLVPTNGKCIFSSVNSGRR